MKKVIDEVEEKAYEAYRVTNDFMSTYGDFALLEYMYPERDGKVIDERAADLMMLRQQLYSLQRACEFCIDKLSRVLSEED